MDKTNRLNLTFAVVSLAAATVASGQDRQAVADKPQPAAPPRYRVVDLGKNVFGNVITDAGRILGSIYLGGADRDAGFGPARKACARSGNDTRVRWKPGSGHEFTQPNGRTGESAEYGSAHILGKQSLRAGPTSRFVRRSFRAGLRDPSRVGQLLPCSNLASWLDRLSDSFHQRSLRSFCQSGPITFWSGFVAAAKFAVAKIVLPCFRSR